MKLKCPKCKSKNLRYYERREHAFEIDDSFKVRQVSDGLLLDTKDGYMMQVECQDCNLTSDEALELEKLRDHIVKVNNRLNS